MTSGSGPLECVEYVPLTGNPGLASAGGSGGRATVSPCPGFPSDPACIVISGQKLGTPTEKKMYINLVGSGSECLPGDWIPRKAVCPGCGHSVLLIKSGCGLVSCPRCSKRWARRAGERAGARVYGAFLAGISRHKPRHISFELSWLEGTEINWGSVKRQALSLGCLGGALVVHPWRIKPDIERAWEQAKAQHKTELNRYDWVKKFHGMAGFVWAPHCHGLVYGRFADVRQGSDIFLYRNIRKLTSLHMLEGVATYLFTHTFAPRGNEKVFRYFGICSPQCLKPDWTGTVHEPMYCEKCGKMMLDEGALVLHVHYIALGWHKVSKGPPA